MSRVVCYLLGAALLLAVAGVIGLSAVAVPVPGILETVVTAAIAGLVGLLAPQPHQERIAEKVADNLPPAFETKHGA